MTFIHDLNITFSLNHVLRMQGVRDTSEPPKKVMELLEELFEIVDRDCLLESAVAYDSLPVRVTEHERIFFKGEISLNSPLLSKRLGKALEIVIMVCTIGPHLEKKVTDYFNQGNRLRSILLDGFGSAAVESLAQEACRIIREQAELRGYETSSPLSPGMLDFPLSEQWAICKIVHAEQIRVSLTQTAMMVPRKSTSMVMGIGLRMPTWTKAEACKTCPLRHTCRFRVHV